MSAITTVTRKLWRNTLRGVPQAPFFDIVHFDARGEVSRHALRNEKAYAIYDCEYVAQPASFQEIEAHTELGGYALALRDGSIYEVFTEQDGPGFAELWPDVTYHMVVNITEVRDGS